MVCTVRQRRWFVELMAVVRHGKNWSLLRVLLLLVSIVRDLFSHLGSSYLDSTYHSSQILMMFLHSYRTS
jgi:hypothetical protein